MSNSIKSLASQVLIAFSAVVIALAVVDQPPTEAKQDPSQVQVVNPPAQPVPTVAQGTTAVRVDNPASSPVLTRNVDGAIQPFVTSTGASLPGGASQSDYITVLEVPAGKRLVLEHISCWTQLWTGESAYTIVLIYAPSLIGSFYVPQTNAGNGSSDGTNFPTFLANQPLKAYAPPGAIVQVLFRRLGVFSGAPGNALCTLSGYLADVP